MYTIHELRLVLCQAYSFVFSLGRIFDMFFCVEKGQTLEQVGDKPIIYLCISKTVEKEKVANRFRELFKESTDLTLLLGATGELFECPNCYRKMTDYSFPAHLKEYHRFNLIAVNASTCDTDLEKKIARNIKKVKILPDNPKGTLEDFLNNSTLNSLYHSSIKSEKRKIRETTYRKFVCFENAIRNAKNVDKTIDPSTLNRAMAVQNAIRDAINTKLIVVIKKKRRKKSRKNNLQIFSGGLPGLGKR